MDLLRKIGTFEGETFKLTIVTDGVKVTSRRSKGTDQGEWFTKDSSTDAGAMMTAGAGLYGFLFSQELDSLSDFSMGPKEKVGAREAQRIDYRIRFKSLMPLHTFATQVWLDSETNLPLRRVISHETIDVRITETYEIRLNGKIDPKLRQARPDLEGIKYKGRWVVIYSKYDIGCALEKHSSPECRGHDPASALRLARAALLYSLRR